MKLISSREAVDFLSQAAPRPWVQRMLRWMAFDEGLAVFSREGQVQAYGHVYDFILQLDGHFGNESSPELDAAIREKYSEEIAAKLVGKPPLSRFEDEPFTWDETDEPIQLDIGFFLFASEIDWDEGIIISDFIPASGELHDTFFPWQEMFGTELHRPEYKAEIKGLSFEFSKIEMLLPSVELRQTQGFSASQADRRRPAGRPAKWDWEGAMAHVVSQAQHPDGLPTGPGAQARIEELISGWFMQQTQESPSPSQVRQRAAKIIQMIETPTIR